jgi:hypothetical protein
MYGSDGHVHELRVAKPAWLFSLGCKGRQRQCDLVDFETVSLSTLKRSGTQRKDFADNVGKTVTVRACLAKNGEKNRAAAETIKFPDGEVHRIGQDVEGKFSDNAKQY